MKKIILLMTVSALLLAVTACASTKETTTQETQPAVESVKEETVSVEQASEPVAEVKAGPVDITNPVPEGNEELLDNFEEENIWQSIGDSWDQWGSHNLSLAAEVTKKWASEGECAGEWTFDVAGPETSKQASFVSYAIDPDWTGVKYLAIDVNNTSGQTIFLKAHVQDNVDWKWSDALEEVEIPEGITRNVTFTFNEINCRDSLACVIIDVTNENKGGTILVDNVRLYRE